MADRRDEASLITCIAITWQFAGPSAEAGDDRAQYLLDHPWQDQSAAGGVCTGLA
jgi:hypothetical protein